MVVGRVVSAPFSRSVAAHGRNSLLRVGRRQTQHNFPTLTNQFHSLIEPQNKVVTGLVSLLHNSLLNSSTFQRFGISSSTSPQFNEKEAQSQNGQGSPGEHNDDGRKTSADAPTEDPEQKARSDSDLDSEGDLSMEDLVKLLAEKEELLKTRHKEIESMKDKVLRSLAESENVMERTKREAENSKKFAIQSFAKSLLDVADNLGRASSVVKESFDKIDTSMASAGAVPLLKTLLEGVDMTDKQLAEVFRKFGVEKYDPKSEQFDPSRHNAVFQVPDSTKPRDSVAVVLKPGYMLFDRIIRPAEVGVVVHTDGDEADKGSET